MGMFSNIGKALRKLLPKSIGESTFAGFVNGLGRWNAFGGWSADRSIQAQKLQGWQFIAIRAICEEIAMMPPQVANLRPESPTAGGKPKSKAHLNSHQRSKALVSIQQHEELELVDGNHPLLLLLRNPNGPDVGWGFWYKLVLYLELTGSAYIWMPKNKAGLPAEFWVIPSHWVRTITGTEKIIDAYEIRPFGGMSGGPGSITIPADDMVAIQYPNPYWVLDGYGPMQAVAKWIDTAESIDASRWFSFKNGPQPGMIVELAADSGQDPDPEQIDRFKQQFRQHYQGEQNAGMAMVLPPGAQGKPFLWNPNEMDYIKSQEQVRDNILATWRVSKSIVGITEDVNFASADVARMNFHQSTIKPKLSLIGAVLTEKVAKLYDPTLCVYWPDQTPTDPAMLNETVKTLVAAAAITPNEIRQKYGYEPFKYGGDDPIVRIGVSPLPIGTGETAGPLDVSADAAERYGLVKPSDEGTPAGAEEEAGALAAAAGSQASSQTETQPPKKSVPSVNGHGKRWEE